MSGQIHQTLSRFTLWPSGSLQLRGAVASLQEDHTSSTFAEQIHKKCCLFSPSDSSKLFHFCFYLISTQQIGPDVPAPPSSFPGRLNIKRRRFPVFHPWKGRDVESLARLSEQRSCGWYSQCRCTWLNCWGHVSVSHESRWSGAIASAWLSDWVLQPSGRFQQRER